MKTVVIPRAGAASVLRVEEKPDPVVVENNVIIEVRAAGLNFADILARQGIYPDAPALPATVGYEVSGIVETIGDKVDKSWLGKSVMALTRFGGQSSKVMVPIRQVFEKPPSISFEDAAAIPVNYLTAYGLLKVLGGLRTHETVLIHNAGGGVGLAALDIAKHIGAETIGTASERKHAFLKVRGLDHAIDYRQVDWFPEVQKITGHRGVELVIDPLGAGSWKKSYKILRPTGRLGMFGMSAAASGGGTGSKIRMLMAVLQSPWFHPLGLLDNNRCVFGLNLGHLWDEADKLILWMKEIIQGIGDGWINPHVDRTFTFAQAAEAHRYLEERKNIGKVLLIP